MGERVDVCCEYHLQFIPKIIWLRVRLLGELVYSCYPGLTVEDNFVSAP